MLRGTSCPGFRSEITNDLLESDLGQSCKTDSMSAKPCYHQLASEVADNGTFRELLQRPAPWLIVSPPVSEAVA